MTGALSTPGLPPERKRHNPFKPPDWFEECVERLRDELREFVPREQDVNRVLLLTNELITDANARWLRMHPPPLTFDDLTLANRNRCGASFHPLDDWSPGDWAMAAAGELGEAFNKIKKARRSNYRNLATEREAIAHELADAVIYIDLLCSRLDIYLGAAVKAKFNIVSERVGSEIRL